MLAPETPADLAEAMGVAGARGLAVELAGRSSKRLMAGPVEPAETAISTAGLARILDYEPRDLTISVEAGLPWRELARTVGERGQMVPLDPPFASEATVGGVVAANCSGPRRRLYGTARDLVIGMRFATLEGKLAQSGGMVVKNVAGLDMAKLMIGSFGTLAAIAVVNFKLAPVPEAERSFLLAFPSAEEAFAARDRVLKGALQPAALDVLNPAAGASVGRQAWLLAIRAAGRPEALDRYEREISPLGEGVVLEGPGQSSLWEHIGEFTPRFLAAHPDGAVVRASCTLKGLEEAAPSLPGPVVARGGTGVCYGYFEACGAAAEWLAGAVRRGVKAVFEFAPGARKPGLDLWPCPGPDLELMKRVKRLFDPLNLLNRGRMYGRI